MAELTLETLCNYIVLIGAVILAIERIYKAVKKPVDTVKEKQDEHIVELVDQQIEEKVVPMFDEKMEECRVDRQKEYEQVLDKMQDMITGQMTPYFEEIERINLEQNEKIETLTRSSKDVLRQNIINIYEHNKGTKQLNEMTREFLDDCFKDYTKQKGNGYIEKLYHRMDNWDVIVDE